MDTLRALLIQRAARLQGRPALTAPDWGTLSWGTWRNRVEGTALGLLATERPLGAAVFSATGTPWDWAAEVAAACAGLRWEPGGERIPAQVLGGDAFNHDQGRGPYHDREHDVEAHTAFLPGLDQGEVLLRLQRLNRRLGWDHATEVRLPLAALGTPEIRAALWSLLYAGGHAVLEADPEPRGLGRWFGTKPAPPTDLTPFSGFWD